MLEVICLKSGVNLFYRQVTGINEYAPQWAEFIPAGPTYTLPENANIGSQILTLSATDEDDGIHGVVLYSLGAITTSK